MVSCYFKIKSGWVVSPLKIRITKNVDNATFEIYSFLKCSKQKEKSEKTNTFRDNDLMIVYNV